MAQQTALAKGPPAVGARQRQGLCIDWHNVLQHGNELSIRDGVRSALKKVLSSGRFNVWVISFVGKDRRRKTEHLMNQCLAPLKAAFPCFLGWTTTLKKVGNGGKVAVALDKGLSLLIDDNAEICKEANDVGMLVYPIITVHNSHNWWPGPKYTNFEAAVEDLLNPVSRTQDAAASSSAA